MTWGKRVGTDPHFSWTILKVIPRPAHISAAALILIVQIKGGTYNNKMLLYSILIIALQLQRLQRFAFFDFSVVQG